MGNKNNVLTEAEIIASREKISNVLALEEMKKIGAKGLSCKRLKLLLIKEKIKVSKSDEKMIRKIVELKGFIEVIGVELYDIINTFSEQEDIPIQRMLNRYIIGQIVQLFEEIKDEKNYSILSVSRDLSKLGIKISFKDSDKFFKQIKNFRNKYISHLSIDYDNFNIKDISFNRYDEYILLYLQSKLFIYSIFELFNCNFICLNKLDEFLIENLHETSIHNKDKIANLYEEFNNFNIKISIL